MWYRCAAVLVPIPENRQICAPVLLRWAKSVRCDSALRGSIITRFHCVMILVDKLHEVCGSLAILWYANIFHAMLNFIFESIKQFSVISILCTYTGWPPKNGTVDFSGLCSDQQLYFITLLDRASFPHYNNTKIIIFGWELFILWVISYGLSFSGFARFPEFRVATMTASAVHKLTEYCVQWSVYCP